MDGLAIDPNDGKMYGTTYSNQFTFSELISIDPVTGQTEIISRLATPFPRGLGFTADGRLLTSLPKGRQASNLVEINTETGEMVELFEMPVDRIEHLAFRPEDGVLFAMTYGPYSLSTIDLEAGTVTQVGESLSRPQGLAFVSIPEPMTAVLAMLVCALQIAASRSYRP